MMMLQVYGLTHWRGLLAVLLLMLSITAEVPAQGSAFDGYTLFNPTNSRTTYLVDMNNNTVHTWSHARSGGYAVYLLENGNLLRPSTTSIPSIRGAASAGLLQEVDWDGNIVWEFDYASPSYVTHHDIEPMPNGNVLLIAWEVMSASEASASGRSNAIAMWPDHIIEVKPESSKGGSIVWEWHAWDHLVQDRDPAKKNYGVVAEHPELININLGSLGGPGTGDWLHINGISYSPLNDQIVISSHTLDEIYVIDHSTTTEEAAGHTGGRHGKGGDLLYRWGRPQNYGAPAPTYLDVVHCPYWIPEGLPGEGHILLFNNNQKGGKSIIAEIVPPVDQDDNYILQSGQAYGPVTPAWSYSNGPSFYSNHLGGNQRLPNGNTLISESTSGYLFEIDVQGNEVWSFKFHQEIARSLRYASDYPGLAKLLATHMESDYIALPELAATSYPNPFTDFTTISYTTNSAEPLHLTVHNALGKQVRSIEVDNGVAGKHSIVWNGRDETGRRVTPGLYFYKLWNSVTMVSGKILVSEL